MSIGESLLSKGGQATTEPQVSVTQLRLDRDQQRRAVQRHLADASSALQRHQPGTPMHAQVLEMRTSLLEQLARMDRMTDDDLRTVYGPKYAAGPAKLAETKRQMNTPEAKQARKEAIWQEVAEQSAKDQRRLAIEAEVKLARQEAADRAEAEIRAKHADEHQAA